MKPMEDEVAEAIEAELCTCLHTKADHHGPFGDGACSVTTLAARTHVGRCPCEKFTFKTFIWKAGRTPRGEP
jgi:hypothetical protein